MTLTHSMTVLQVTDFERSMAFYQSLGFADQGVWNDPPIRVAILQMGQVPVMLQEGEKSATAGGRWNLYAYTKDVDGLNARLVAKGIEVTGAPVDQWYNCRDFAVYDPDGHCIAFAQILDEEKTTHG